MNTAACLAPEHFLDRLSDSELLAATCGLVGRSNQLLAALLAHLGEVEARGIHRTRACSSLYTYCIHELRLSEDEAYRRVTASRLVRRFPALLEAMASGELHLTGLLMLGPHLTENNLSEVLLRAKHCTKKEVAALVRVLDPLPDVPARIEPLGPAPARLAPAAPSWSAFVEAMCPVRELAPGERPRDWVASDERRAANGAEGSEQMAGAALGTAGAPAAEPALLEAHAPVRIEPQRYRVQFTAGEEYVKLVEQAKALLAHESPHVGLDEIHLCALRALIAQLKKQKYAVTVHPRKSADAAPPGSAASSSAAFSSARPGRGPASSVVSCSAPTAQSSAPPRATEAELDNAQPPALPRQRGRHVPAAVRRAVFERDGGRCTYVSASGERCRETHLLELHHVRAYALGGQHSEANVVLRCRAHNTLAAEEELGRDFVDERRDSLGHEPFAAQTLEAL